LVYDTERWVLSIDFFTNIHEKKSLIYYSDILVDFNRTIPIERKISRLVKISFKRLLKHNPNGVTLPFYSNQKPFSPAFFYYDSLELYRTWQDLELDNRILNYPCEVLKKGTGPFF